MSEELKRSRSPDDALVSNPKKAFVSAPKKSSLRGPDLNIDFALPDTENSDEIEGYLQIV